MSEISENISFPKEEPVSFVESGPKLVEIINQKEKRDNIIKSNQKDIFLNRYQEKTFTEEEGIQDLVDFIDTTIKTAEKNNDTKVTESTRLFKENIVFVGEPELNKAAQGIAQHLVDEAQNGKNIILFPARMRSERYISLLIAEEIDYLTEQTPTLREKFKIDDNKYRIAQHVINHKNESLVVVPDDFIVSGTRIIRFAGAIFDTLIDSGFTSEEASKVIEADVVAMPKAEVGRKISMVNRKDNSVINLNIFSYFSVSEYQDSNGNRVVYPGVSMTGSHSSTDYGFEEVLENLQHYMITKGVEKNLPLLTNIVRPYEVSAKDMTKYKDEVLQKRWDRIQEKYKL